MKASNSPLALLGTLWLLSAGSLYGSQASEFFYSEQMGELTIYHYAPEIFLHTDGKLHGSVATKFRIVRDGKYFVLNFTHREGMTEVEREGKVAEMDAILRRSQDKLIAAVEAGRKADRFIRFLVDSNGRTSVEVMGDK